MAVCDVYVYNSYQEKKRGGEKLQNIYRNNFEVSKRFPHLLMVLLFLTESHIALFCNIYFVALNTERWTS